MINLVSIYSNVFRAAEIAACGGHSLYLLPIANSSNVSPSEKDMATLKEAISTMYRLVDDVQPSTEAAVTPHTIYPKFIGNFTADIVMEITVPDGFLVLRALTGKYETTRDIASRIRKYNISVKPQFDSQLSQLCKSLLKTAVDRLSLHLHDVESILAVSITIASMAGSSVVLPEHIAEAIQYKIVSPANQ